MDTAFLAQGILRAPKVLWEPLEPRVKKQIVAALKSSRKIATPDRQQLGDVCRDGRGGAAGIRRTDAGGTAGRLRPQDARLVWRRRRLRRRRIFPFRLLQQLRHPADAAGRAGGFGESTTRSLPPRTKIVLQRAKRFAEIQERLIAPDGTFPSLGRSTTYRFGAFQMLAQISLLRELPEKIKPAQVRCALTAVIRKMMEAPGTFDANGWLQIGFCGHQPALGESLHFHRQPVFVRRRAAAAGPAAGG